MKKLKLNKKTVANLSKSSIGEVYGGASDTQCISENTCTATCTATGTGTGTGTGTSPLTTDCPTSNFLACQSIAGTVCPASNDIRCHTQGCTIHPYPITNNCTNVCK